MHKFRVFFVLLLTFLGVYESFSQCALPAPASATFCNGQYAEISITDSDPNVRYHWFELLDGKYANRGYGQDGSGRYFTSTGTVSGPGPYTYYYVKETKASVGPSYTANTGGASLELDASKYSMPFESTTDFILDSVTVIVKLTSATDIYGFQIVYNDGVNEYFSDWYTSNRASFAALGGDFYKVIIPVTNIVVKKGTGQNIEFRSVANASQNVAVNEVYWWNGTAFNGANYFFNNIKLSDPGKVVSADTRTPMIMDWKITALCDTTPIQATLSSSCCTPVGSNFKITTSSYLKFPAILTATGADVNSSMYYYWYDADNTLLGSGLNQTTQTITKSGIYTVKVVNEVADANTISCQGKRSISIEDKSIFAINDTTICIGQPFKLSAYGAEGNYKWKSNNALAHAAIITKDASTSAITLTTPGVYEFIVSGDVKLGNIAYDGKFDKFDDRTNYDIVNYPPSFETTYGNTNSSPVGAFITGNNQFRVDDRILAWSANNEFCTTTGYYEKTDPISGDIVSRGNIFYADANTGGVETGYTVAYANAQYLWQLSNQPVEPNTDYEFSLDVSEWNSDVNPDIMLLVNGVPLELFVDGVQVTTGAKKYWTFDGTPCTWKTLIGKWNSGTNTSATITVSEVSKFSSGHEFAMDDITFSTGRGTQYDTVIVTIVDCSEILAKATPNAGVCIGGDVELSAITNGFVKEWKNNSGVVIGTTATVSATATTNPSEFSVTAKFPIKTLNINSDFESGNVGIGSGLNPRTDAQFQAGDYVVVKGNETWLSDALQTATDHTTGSGSFMISKVANDRSTYVVYSNSISVQSGKDYGFSFYLRNLLANPATGAPANVEIWINNIKQTSVKGPTGNQIWDYNSLLWTSTITGTVNFEIRGEAFPTYMFRIIGLDDVIIAEAGNPKTANVSVATIDCRTLIPRPDTTACIGVPIRMYAETNGFITQWSPDKWLSNANSSSPIATPGSDVVYTVEAKYPVVKYFNNSNFNNGYSDFVSPLSPRNEYYFGYGEFGVIHGNEANLSDLVVNPRDHTVGTVDGNFLISKVNRNNAVEIFSKTITGLTVGDTLGISFWLANMFGDFTNGQYSDATVKIMIGSDTVKTTSVGQDRAWHYFDYSWIVTSTSVKVSLVSPRLPNKNAIIGLDDLNIVKLGNPKTDIVSINVNTDCFKIEATTDNICEGDSILIKATTNGLFQGWEELGGGVGSIMKPTFLDTYVKPTGITRYVASSRFPLNNLIVNGDFELGNQGFESPGLTYGQYSISQGNYGISNNPESLNGAYVQIGDHTTGTGLMMVIDANSLGQIVYSTNVAVEKDSTYGFSVWVTDVNKDFYNPPILTFVIDGVDLSNKIVFPDSTHAWFQFNATWISTKTGTITIQLRNDNPSGNGNDFALDDVSFSALYDEVIRDTIEVIPCKFMAKDTTGAFCETTLNLGTAVIDLTQFNATVKTPDPKASVVSWHTALPAGGSNLVATPTAVTALDNSNFYAVVAHDDFPSGGDTAMVTITISPLPVVTFTAVPQKCAGDTATVTLVGTPVGGVFKGTGVSADKFSVPAVAGDYKLNYVYTDAIGCADSLEQTVAVKPIPTSLLSSNSPICTGETIDIKLSTSAGINADFAWTGPNSNTGSAQDFSKTIAAIADSGKYVVAIADSGCVKNDTINIVITPSTVIDSVIASKTVYCEGETLSITAYGRGTGTLTYDWLKGGTSTGITSKVFSISSLALADSGTYSVIVSGDCGPITSTPVIDIKVKAKPTITTQPIMAKGCVGSAAELKVVAAGSGPLSYQWKKGNVDIAGATNATLKFASLALADDGIYTVEVSNDYCTSILSDTASVKITDNETPKVSLATDIAQGCGDGSTIVKLKASAAEAGQNPLYTFKAGTSLIGILKQLADTVEYTLPANSGIDVETLKFSVEMISMTECIAPQADSIVYAFVSVRSYCCHCYCP
jgi:hypothetical protein